MSLGARFEWRTLCGDFENSYSPRSTHVSGLEQLAYIFVWASCMFKAGGNLNVAEIQISNICHICHITREILPSIRRAAIKCPKRGIFSEEHFINITQLIHNENGFEGSSFQNPSLNFSVIAELRHSWF